MRYSLYRYRRKSTGSVLYRIAEFDEDVLNRRWGIQDPGKGESSAQLRCADKWIFDRIWHLEDEGQFEWGFMEEPWPVEITVSDLV